MAIHHIKSILLILQENFNFGETMIAKKREQKAEKRWNLSEIQNLSFLVNSKTEKLNGSHLPIMSCFSTL